MPRFAGTPIEQTKKPRFGGSPVANFSGVSTNVDSSYQVVPRVTREQRQAQIAQADAALNYENRLNSLNQQEQAGRLSGIGGRGILTGLAAIPDLAVSPITNLVNRALPENMQQRDIGGSVNALLDALGTARPETGGERMLQDVTAGTSAALVPAGIGNNLTRALSPVVQRVGQSLAARPGLQLASGVTGATASSATRESGGGPGAQLVAGLLGSFAPAVAVEGLPALASGALSRSVPEQRKEVARMAADMGIELSPAQLSDSRFLKWAQSMLRSIPFTGAQGRYQRQVGQFNRQLANAIGQDADNITPEVYSAARQAQSQQFNDLTARNALKVDQSLMTRLQEVADKAVTQDMRNLVDELTGAFFSEARTGPGGVTVPGQAYQALDSTLNNIVKNGGMPGHYAGQVRDAIRNAMDRSISPEDAAAWRQLRQEYGARKTLTGLAAKAEGGNIPPAQVMGAATVGNSSREAMAAGNRGPIGDLARIGQLMKEPPTSGTTERSVVSGMLGGATMIDPVTGTLTAAGLNLLSRGIDSRALARLMIQENPGMSLEVAQRIINQSLPAATAVQATQE